MEVSIITKFHKNQTLFSEVHSHINRQFDVKVTVGQRSGFDPNKYTQVLTVKASGHRGWTLKILEYFNSMNRAVMEGFQSYLIKIIN